MRGMDSPHVIKEVRTSEPRNVGTRSDIEKSFEQIIDEIPIERNLEAALSNARITAGANSELVVERYRLRIHGK